MTLVRLEEAVLGVVGSGSGGTSFNMMNPRPASHPSQVVPKTNDLPRVGVWREMRRREAGSEGGGEEEEEECVTMRRKEQ